MTTDIYQNVTDRIVAALERGAAPWVKPWTATGEDIDINHRSGKPYHGINLLVLWAERQIHGYDRARWLTYRQAKEAGGNVRKGEKGTQIVFWKFLEHEEQDETRRIPLARAYTVFNLEQCDGIELHTELVLERPLSERMHDAREFCAATGATIKHGGDRACYVPSQDLIRMPARRTFETDANYYSMLLHELTHWTSAETRCNRVLGKRFGDDTYAVEELIAELGAAFASADLGVTGELRHAEYIGSWLRVLKADSRAVFTAASAARKAHEYLKSLQPQAQLESEKAA